MTSTDRYQQLDAELLMDPRDYIRSLEDMADKAGEEYRSLQEYAQKADAERVALRTALAQSEPQAITWLALLRERVEAEPEARHTRLQGWVRIETRRPPGR